MKTQLSSVNGFVAAALALGLLGCSVSGVSSSSEDDHKNEVALQVLGLNAMDVTDTSAVIEWSTTVPTVGVLRVSDDPSLIVSQSRTTVMDAHHTTLLSDLEPDTEYHYRVQAISATGDTSSARGKSFRTAQPYGYSDSTAPVISGIEVRSLTSSSALIAWSTDDACRCLLLYDTAVPLDQEVEEYPEDTGKYTYGHSVTLTGLEAQTDYTFQIEAVNLAGLPGSSAAQSFTTLQAPTLTFCPGTIAAAPGETFQLDVCVVQAQDLAGAAITIDYDPLALEVVGGSAGIEPGAFYADNGGHLFMPPAVDAVAGRIVVEASWIVAFDGDTALGTAADGDGTICRIPLRLKSGFLGGSTPLAYVTLDLDSDGRPDTRLIDYQRLPIEFVAESGQIERSED